MQTRVAILTCVGNLKSNGNGPGHTAVVVGSDVFSFEDIGNGIGFFSDGGGSGWVKSKVPAYMTTNAWRPVIVQEMKLSLVSTDKVLAYINKSIDDDDDYGGSGVCSSQAANAIDAATTNTFNPRGIDTPFKVFKLIKDRGMAASSYYVWGDREATWWGEKGSHAAHRLKNQYAAVSREESKVSWA